MRTRPAIVPELYVTNLARSLQFYVDVLGFVIEYERPDDGFAAISFAGSHLMLEAGHPNEGASEQEFQAGSWRTGDLEYPFGRGVSFEVTIADVESMHMRVVEAGIPLKLNLEERTYAIGDERVTLRQFLVMDPDGYLIRFAQRIRTADERTA